MKLDDDLALAHRIVDAAAPISMRAFEAGVVETTKSDGSPVTSADYEVERSVLAMLKEERPDDCVLSEEAGAVGHAARRWIVDPIDGTVAFIAGGPIWGTQIALEVDGEIVVGVVDCPALGIRYWAARGEGAFRSNVSNTTRGDAQRLSVSTVDSLVKTRFAVNAKAVARGSENVKLLSARCTWTDPTIHYSVDLVEGRIDVVLFEDFGGPWDYAPWVVITEEAGGVFFDLAGGRRIDTRSAVFTTARLASAVRDMLGCPQAIEDP